jgi:hypothetical protein
MKARRLQLLLKAEKLFSDRAEPERPTLRVESDELSVMSDIEERFSPARSAVFCGSFA